MTRTILVSFFITTTLLDDSNVQCSVESDSNWRFRVKWASNPIESENSNSINMSSTTFSTSRSSRIQLASISRLRSSFLKKLPEPLRRSVADCLSSPPSSAVEPSRTLRVRHLFPFPFYHFFFFFNFLCCSPRW